MRVWIVHEFETATGHEAQGRPEKLLTTTLFESETDARSLADHMLMLGAARRVNVREQFVNPDSRKVRG